MEVVDLQILQNAEIFLCGENFSFCGHGKESIIDAEEEQILQSKLQPWEDYSVVGFLVIVGKSYL